MDVLWFLVAVGAALALVLLFQRVTVYEYQSGLQYTNGRFVRVLKPGRYWIYKLRTSVIIVDARRRFVTIGGQEVLSSDGVPMKVSLAVAYAIESPEKAVNEIENFEQALYLTLQIGLRSVMGRSSAEELIENRNELGPRLLEESASKVSELGLKLELADVKDIMLPGEVKRLFAQVVKARKEGQAALELARGETAAMRSLANIANLMEAHPSLLQLRALQQLAASPNNTLMIGMPKETTVLPNKKKTSAPQTDVAPEENDS